MTNSEANDGTRPSEPERNGSDVRARFEAFLSELGRELEALPFELARGGSTVLAEVDVNGSRYVLSQVAPPKPRELSPREREIALLVQQGLTNKAIAHRLRLGESTVATHLRRIFSKLNIDSRVILAQRSLSLIGRSGDRTSA